MNVSIHDYRIDLFSIKCIKKDISTHYTYAVINT